VSLFAPVSEFVGAKLREAGVIHDRIRVKPNFAWPTRRRVSEGDYFLTLGRLSPEKGVDTIVGALPLGARLLVVGDGPQRAKLASLAGPGVELRTAVDEPAVSALLQRARALLVPSRWYEGQPRVILEAFAAGVPVLASSIGGLPELVQEGVNGFLVDPSDTAAWRAAMGRLMDNALVDHLGDGAYRSWRRRFTPELALFHLESLYDAADRVAVGLKAL
jgi:glycosyltransferase involved in cell wall biosynthesis